MVLLFYLCGDRRITGRFCVPKVFRNDITELPNDLDSYLAIIPDLLAQSKSDNTVKKYYYGFLRWKKWAEINHISDVDILPTKPLYLALYLASLVQFSATSSPVCDAYYSIKWAHSIIGADSPTDSQLVKCVFEGAKRKLGSQIKKKEPITPELLQAMYDKFFCVENIFSQRTICACILGYAGFMRVSELLNLRYFDINFKTSHISIFIEKSKTDIYRDGNWLIIAKTGTTLCPVRNLELYMQWSGIQSDSNLYLFRNLSQVKGKFVFRSMNKPLSYTRMREIFIDAFSPFVPDIKSYGLHSLRAGGATAAARFGVSDRLFKRHGRWKSDTSKDGYVKDDLSERMIVSQNLGI
ncbi:uncharacterized protein LOC134693496 [Mytilus trossulus]|uniref:uncharacterized protein LOC134693496 n=1 Tax=Mytilus trossulus TaxID=6551 RepID=UPI0030062D74